MTFPAPTGLHPLATTLSGGARRSAQRLPLRQLAVGAVGAVVAAAGALGAAPAQATGTVHQRIVHVGGCSGAVLNTRSGTWVVTAAHCGRVTTVRAGYHNFAVVRRLTLGGPEVTGDVMLVQVRGNIKKEVGGGFAVGAAPRRGSRINVWGFPSGSGRLVGCNSLVVSYAQGRYPQVNHCYLPNGTSGGPWYTNDVVLRGVVGGLNGGGATNYITNTVAFSPSVVRWVLGHTS